MPAGTSTELRANDTLASTSVDGDEHDNRGACARSGERVGAETDHLRDSELDGDVPDCFRKSTPVHVGLGAAQDEDVAAARRLPGGELDVVPTEVRVHSVAEFHCGAAGAVVDEGVVIEADQR